MTTGLPFTNILVAVIVPPTYKSFPIPTPPATTKAPVVVLTLDVAVEMFTRGPKPTALNSLVTVLNTDEVDDTANDKILGILCAILIKFVIHI